MIKVKIFGMPTSTLEYVKLMIKNTADRAGLNLNLEEISEVENLIEEGIVSIPAVRINDQELISYNGKTEINDFIGEINLAILKEGNYGLMKKFLVPTDMSKTSTNAVAFLSALALKHNGLIEVMNCYRPPNTTSNSDTSLDVNKIAENNFNLYYTNLVSKWIGDNNKGPIFTKRFCTGFAGDMIPLRSNETGATIVMGSTGDSNILKKIFGSVTIKVAQNSPQPIFIIPSEVNYHSFKNILVACESPDLDPNSLNQIIEYAVTDNSDIHLLHVNSTSQKLGEASFIAPWQNKYDTTKVRFHEVFSDDIFQTINETVIELNIDLLVLMPKKRNILSLLFHESETKKMVFNSKIPLLIIPNKNP